MNYNRLKESKIDWRKVVNDVAEKNAGKNDLTVRSTDITIDESTGKLTSTPFAQQPVDFSLTDWSLSQLFSKFDMPASYFKDLHENYQYDLIKEHLDYNINSQEVKDLFIRTVQPSGSERLARAILTPTFTPFDNDELVKLLRQTISESDYNIQLVDYSNNGLTAYFRLIFPDSMKDIKTNSVQPDDVVAVGVNIMNSEVGKSSVKIMPMMFRLVCRNGMLTWDTVGNKSDYYQRHSYIDEQKMYEFTSNTMNKAVNVAYEVINDFEKLKEKEIENYEAKIPEILSQVSVPKRMHEPVLKRFKNYWSRTPNMFGLVNSMTRIAKEYNQDDQQELENAAGKLTSRTVQELEVA